MRRMCWIVVATLCLGGIANAGPTATSTAVVTKAAAKVAAPAKRAATDRGTIKQCAGGKCHHIPVLTGHNAGKDALRADPLDKPSGEVWLRAENLGEEVKVNIYKSDGSFDDAALAQLDELFRCVKTGEVRAVRSELYEQLSRIYDHFDGKRVDLVSGFRFAERNSSRHYHASAMDIRIPGVSINAMYKYAESLDSGGMGLGIYPTSGFIHVDFRAPGEPSYRWTDYSGHGGGGKKKPSGHTQPAHKPVS